MEITNNNFKKKIEKWKKFTKSEKKQQEEYFYKELLDDVVSLSKEKWKNNKKVKGKEFDLLITMSGFSPETSVIAGKTISPKKVLVVSSENTKEGIDIIGNYLVKDIGHSNFFHLTCDPTDPLDIYKAIKNKIKEISNNEKIRAIVDITGGKKIMSAAAGLVAWQLDLPICYTESKNYDPILRRPIPGDEEILFLPNPITLYGDEEIKKGIILFDKGQFGEAYNRFNELVERIDDSKYVQFLRDLSKWYSIWLDVDLDKLDAYNKIVEKHLNDPLLQKHYLTEEIKLKLETQINFLKNFFNGDNVVLLINFYLLGMFYANNLKRYDFATLFFYRSLEGCFAFRLQNEYNMNLTNPDYSVLNVDIVDLEEKYIKFAKQFGWKGEGIKLPKHPLGYADAALILLALNDELIEKAYKKDKSKFGEIIDIGNLRNRSILAHGTKPLTQKDSNRVQLFAERFLLSFWDITESSYTESNKNTEEIINNLQFIVLDKK